jgi:hypothetical protein
VTFHPNNTLGDLPILFTDMFVYDDTTAIALPGDCFTWPGQTFLRWDTQPTGSGTSYDPGDVIEIKGDVTLYAIWDIVTYSVSFDPNGAPGSVAMYPGYVYDSVLAIALPASHFPRTGYTFAEWNTQPDGLGATSYGPGDVIEIKSDVYLYAIWQVNTHTVTYYDTADGSVIGAPHPGTPYGATILPPDHSLYTPAGWEFACWVYGSGSRNGDAFADGDLVPDEDVNLYLLWAPVVNWSVDAFRADLYDSASAYKSTIDLSLDLAATSPETYTLNIRGAAAGDYLYIYRPIDVTLPAGLAATVKVSCGGTVLPVVFEIDEDGFTSGLYHIASLPDPIGLPLGADPYVLEIFDGPTLIGTLIIAIP